MKLPADENDIRLTKREYFAGLAMQALTSDGVFMQLLKQKTLEGCERQLAGTLALKDTSVTAVALADALIAELKK